MTNINKNVYIIDDELAVCKALQYLFESAQFNVEIYKNPCLFLEKDQSDLNGCLLTDVRLPEMSGLELLEQLTHQKSNLPVVIMTGFGDIQMAVRAMKAGAKDFLLKPLKNQSILEVVEKCINETSIDNSHEEIKQRINSLSSREHQITNLILDGKLNKEIAYELSLSISTVEAHRASIMQKMKAKNLAQFIKMYFQVENFH